VKRLNAIKIRSSLALGTLPLIPSPQGDTRIYISSHVKTHMLRIKAPSPLVGEGWGEGFETAF